jgi:hypothetical protein
MSAAVTAQVRGALPRARAGGNLLRLPRERHAPRLYAQAGRVSGPAPPSRCAAQARPAASKPAAVNGDRVIILHVPPGTRVEVVYDEGTP